MTVDLSQPVIWTSRGNINESDVEKFYEWAFYDLSGNPIPQPEGIIIKHMAGCRDKNTGEEIKRGAVTLLPPGALEALSKLGQPQ
jgi:hypothetical protein